MRTGRNLYSRVRFQYFVRADRQKPGLPLRHGLFLACSSGQSHVSFLAGSLKRKIDSLTHRPHIRCPHCKSLPGHRFHLRIAPGVRFRGVSMRCSTVNRICPTGTSLTHTGAAAHPRDLLDCSQHPYCSYRYWHLQLSTHLSAFSFPLFGTLSCFEFACCHYHSLRGRVSRKSPPIRSRGLR